MSKVDADFAARWARAVTIEGREVDPAGLAYRIEYARVLAGMTQSDLARQAGIARQTLVRFIGGKAGRPEPATIAALAGALHVAPMWLAFGDGDGPKG